MCINIIGYETYIFRYKNTIQWDMKSLLIVSRKFPFELKI